MSGPKTAAAEAIHAEKHRGPGESFREAMNRIAGALADDDEHFHAFRDVLLEQRFLAGGRIQSAIGSTRRVTPYNCFVSGTIEDSFVDGHGSIMERAKEAAATMRVGGGIGYDFSTLRPRGATIRKLRSNSTGPVSFMAIFDSVCLCVASAGHRRGAQQGVLRIDHPDIEEFIHAKQNTNRLTGFNLSVGVTDEFMAALASGRPFPLRFAGEVYREVDPRTLWDTLMRSAWDWAEPGVLFIDTINRMNNLWYCEKIAATNPCGEQPLPPYGACLLGSFNLTKYVRKTPGLAGVIDLGSLRTDIAVVVRAMDNVIDVATYPLFEQEQEAKSKRRMGLGVTGLANAIEAMGAPYGSDDFLKIEAEILELIRDEAYRASALLAGEKGSFPKLNRAEYLASRFLATLPGDVRQLIAENGIRNSHLTSIAPCGTISLTADNVSSGIEPVFAYDVARAVRRAGADLPEVMQLRDYGAAVFGVEGRKADDVPVSGHLAVLATAAARVDSAVSKTCNVGPAVTWEAFKDIYRHAWEFGIKGLSVFRSEGNRRGILEDGSACKIDPVTGRKDCE